LREEEPHNRREKKNSETDVLQGSSRNQIDQERPDEIELLLDTKRPEVAQPSVLIERGAPIRKIKPVPGFIPTPVLSGREEASCAVQ
jgi:hypothetical protein